MSQDQYVEAFDEFFATKKIQPSLEAFDQFFITPAKGARITINGAHIMFGSEQYLLENKITIQRSDIEDGLSASDKRFVVIGDLLVASFILKNTKINSLKHFIHRLKKQRIQTKLFSYKSAPVAEKIVGVFGFDQKSMVFLKDPKAFAEHVDQQLSANSGGYALAHLNKEEAFRVQRLNGVLTFGEFDNVEYGLSNYDCTIIFNRVNYLPQIISYARILHTFKATCKIFTIITSIILVVLMTMGVLAPWQLLLIAAGCTFIIYSVGNRVAV